MRLLFQSFGDEEKLGMVLHTLNLIEDDGQLTRRCDRRMFYEVLILRRIDTLSGEATLSNVIASLLKSGLLKKVRICS